MIKNWKKFNESIEDLTSKLSHQSLDAKTHLLELIEKSVNSTDDEVTKNFIKSYIDDQESSIIEGLVNDSDFYDFYIKFSSDIDEVLESINYYDESPSDKGIYSIYDYVVESSKKCVIELLYKIQSELFGEDGSPEIKNEE